MGGHQAVVEKVERTRAVCGEGKSVHKQHVVGMGEVSMLCISACTRPSLLRSAGTDNVFVCGIDGDDKDSDARRGGRTSYS